MQPHELSYQWQTQAGTVWSDVANATAQVYTSAAGASARVIATDRAGLATPQTITAAAAAQTTPEGTLLFTPTNGAINAYSQAQIYTATLSISNGVSGGDITYAYQWLTATAAGADFFDVAGYTSGDAAPFSGIRTANLANRSALILSIRMRAVYTDSPNSVLVTFHSEAINPNRPTGGAFCRLISRAENRPLPAAF